MNPYACSSPYETWQALTFVVSPGIVTRRLARCPRWGAAFVLVTFTLVAGGSLHLLSRECLLARLQQGGAEPEGVSTGVMSAITGLVVAIVGLPVKWALSGGFVLLILRALDLNRPGWRSLYALMAHSELISGFMVLYGGIFVLLQLIPGNGFVMIRDPLPGLDRLLPGVLTGTPLRELARHINPFSVWYVAAAGYGVGVLSDAGVRWGTGVAGLVWLVRTVGTDAVRDLLM